MACHMPKPIWVAWAMIFDADEASGYGLTSGSIACDMWYDSIPFRLSCGAVNDDTDPIPRRGWF